MNYFAGTMWSEVVLLVITIAIMETICISMKIKRVNYIFGVHVIVFLIKLELGQKNILCIGMAINIIKLYKVICKAPYTVKSVK